MAVRDAAEIATTRDILCGSSSAFAGPLNELGAPLSDEVELYGGILDTPASAYT